MLVTVKKLILNFLYTTCTILELSSLLLEGGYIFFCIYA